MPHLLDRCPILGRAGPLAPLDGAGDLPGSNRAWAAARRAAVLALAALGAFSGGGCDNPRTGYLPCPTAAGVPRAAALGAPPVQERASQGPAAALPNGQDLLAAAIEALAANQSVQALIRHETTLLGKHVVGRGVYIEEQASPWPRVRLELGTQMGEKAGSLVQVCDGRFLWTFDSLAEHPRVEKVDLVRVAEALGQGADAERRGGASFPIFYGLPKLLGTSLSRFAFVRVDPGRWGPARTPVWRMEGQLLAKRPTLDPQSAWDGRGPNIASGPARGLPPLVPDRVVVVLDQQNLFPLRVEYGWTRPGPLGPQAAVAMDLFDVKLDVPIDPTRFSYSPGNLEVVDQTRQAIERLGRSGSAHALRPAACFWVLFAPASR